MEYDTGKTDSNSYASEAELADYAAARSVPITDEQLLITAMDYIEQQNFFPLNHIDPLPSYLSLFIYLSGAWVENTEEFPTYLAGEWVDVLFESGRIDTQMPEALNWDKDEEPGWNITHYRKMRTATKELS